MTRARWLALAIFAVVLASRAPFGAQTLWAHDSVLYARALEQGFHVDDELRKQRPHAPGYILYVATADLAHDAGLDSNSALVLISALASALGAALLFLLSRRFVPDRIAVLAAIAYAANPLVWQYSEIAFPYTVLGAGSIIVATAALGARGRGLGAVLVASAVFAIAAGFRQDLLVLLAPLWLWSVWPLGPRRAAIAALVVAGVSLGWLVPTIALSGGIGDYVVALRSQATYVGTTYSIVGQGTPALVTNAAMTAYALAWGTLLVAPLAITAALVVAWRMRRTRDEAFALVWCVPPVILYATLHIGEWGYALSALPALYLLAARAVSAAADAAGTRRWMAAGPAWGALVALPAVVFLATPAPFSAAAIRAHDHELTARFTYVRDHYTSERTLILTREDFLLVRYYLPDYNARQYDPEPYVRLSRRMRVGKVDRVVVFTPGLAPERAAEVRKVACAKGIEFVYLDVNPDAVLQFVGERYAVAPTPDIP